MFLEFYSLKNMSIMKSITHFGIWCNNNNIKHLCSHHVHMKKDHLRMCYVWQTVFRKIILKIKAIFYHPQRGLAYKLCRVVMFLIFVGNRPWLYTHCNWIVLPNQFRKYTYEYQSCTVNRIQAVSQHNVHVADFGKLCERNTESAVVFHFWMYTTF